MYAVDGGERRSSNARIFITVIRNEFPPYFITSVTGPFPYSAELIYTTPVSANVIVDVDAIDDRDQFNQVRYELQVDSVAENYFQINEVTGQITLIGDLTDAAVADRPQFNVSYNSKISPNILPGISEF